MDKINEAIEKILEWQEETRIVVSDILIYTAYGGWYLMLKLYYDGLKLCHEFYIGGMPTRNNWKMYLRDELSMFLEEAKVKLKGEKGE